MAVVVRMPASLGHVQTFGLGFPLGHVWVKKASEALLEINMFNKRATRLRSDMKTLGQALVVENETSHR